MRRHRQGLKPKTKTKTKKIPARGNSLPPIAFHTWKWNYSYKCTPRSESPGYAHGNVELMMAGDRRSTFIWITSSVICYLLFFLHITGRDCQWFRRTVRQVHSPRRHAVDYTDISALPTSLSAGARSYQPHALSSTTPRTRCRCSFGRVPGGPRTRTAVLGQHNTTAGPPRPRSIYSMRNGAWCLSCLPCSIAVWPTNTTVGAAVGADRGGWAYKPPQLNAVQLNIKEVIRRFI